MRESVHVCMGARAVLPPVEGGGFAREALQVLAQGRGLQLRLCGAVHWPCLTPKHLPAHQPNLRERLLSE